MTWLLLNKDVLLNKINERIENDKKQRDMECQEDELHENYVMALINSLGLD